MWAQNKDERDFECCLTDKTSSKSFCLQCISDPSCISILRNTPLQPSAKTSFHLDPKKAPFPVRFGEVAGSDFDWHQHRQLHLRSRECVHRFNSHQQPTGNDMLEAILVERTYWCTAVSLHFNKSQACLIDIVHHSQIHSSRVSV